MRDSQSGVLGVIVPCFNEESSLGITLAKLYKLLLQHEIQFRIVIVDDCSQDATWPVAQSFVGKNTIAVQVPVNSGKGAAIKLGLTNLETEYVAFIDADGDISIESIINGYNILLRDEKISACIGSKRHKDSKVFYPFTRVILSKVYNVFVRALFGLRLRDTQTGVKVFRRSALEDVISDVSSQGFAFDLELCVRFRQFGFEIVEIPVIIDHRFNSTVGLFSAYQMLVETIKVKINTMNHTHYM